MGSASGGPPGPRPVAHGARFPGVALDCAGGAGPHVAPSTRSMLLRILTRLLRRPFCFVHTEGASERPEGRAEPCVAVGHPNQHRGAGHRLKGSIYGNGAVKKGLGKGRKTATEE
jgi:hypothetical protein